MGSSTELSDLEFVRAFEACTLGTEAFHHRDHIRLAWVYLQTHGEEAALTRIRESIRKFAAYHGKSDKYHETITMAWLRLVRSASARLAGNTTFDELLAHFPELLDKRTLEKFYSPASLESEKARTSWVEPDLQPLP